MSQDAAERCAVPAPPQHREQLQKQLLCNHITQSALDRRYTNNQVYHRAPRCPRPFAGL